MHFSKDIPTLQLSMVGIRSFIYANLWKHISAILIIFSHYSYVDLSFMIAMKSMRIIMYIPFPSIHIHINGFPAGKVETGFQLLSSFENCTLLFHWENCYDTLT